MADRAGSGSNASSTNIPTFLKVNILRATGLQNADYFNTEGAGLNQGLSDPFCTCEVVGKPYSRFTTDVLMDTLNPEWNHKALIADFSPGDSLLFCVWDRDFLKWDDFLGQATLTSEQFFPLGFVGRLQLSQDDRSDFGTLSIEIKVATSWDDVPSGLGLRRQVYVRYRRIANRNPSSITGLGIRASLKAPFKKVGEVYHKAKAEAKAKALEITTPMIRQILQDAGQRITQDATADPDMPSVMRSWIGTFVQELWNDIITEVEFAIEEARWGVEGNSWHDVVTLSQVGVRPCCCSPQWLRAEILYHFLPYNKSVFGCLWDPIFLLFLWVSLLPLVRVGFFALILMLIAVPCPPDEYQLVQLILQFKGIQFLSGGAAAAFQGGVLYYLCVGDGGTHSCNTSGPGQSIGMYVNLADLCGSCILVWVAFLLLPRSLKAAGLRRMEVSGGHEEDSDAEDSGAEAEAHQTGVRGGRLQRLLCYDLVCFATTMALLILLEGLRYRCTTAVRSLDSAIAHLDSWHFRASLFWARVFYSLLALPFTFFNVPVFQRVLTHTIATGYNRRGAIVAFVLPPLSDDNGTGASRRGIRK